jgi:tRNA A-37 threonylcarbamoyl transferase component Bud32
MGSRDELAWTLLTPAWKTNAHAATATVGKYAAIPVAMETNARAKKTVTDPTLPPEAFDATGYMRHMFRDAPDAWKHLASGGFGSAFLVTVTGKTRPLLQRLHDDVMNKVDYARVNSVPLGTKVVLKVMTTGPENIHWSRERGAGKMLYLKYKYEKERRKHSVANKGKKKIDPAAQRAIDDAMKKYMSSLDAMDENERRRYLETFVKNRKRTIWESVLRDGSVDASNHKYIMTRPPVTFKCASGTATVRARDTIPNLYFGGSHNAYGVYTIVMGFVHGKLLKHIKNEPTPGMVANLEKAMFTFAASGVEHGDAHTGNIFADLNDNVCLIDFGMSVIMPRASKDRALRKLGGCVRALQTTGTWPEDVSNSVWYGADHRGENERSIMRYLNSYMKAKGYTWYNPTGKMLRYMKRKVKKRELDVARKRIWAKVCTVPTGGDAGGGRRSPDSALSLRASSPNSPPSSTRVPRDQTPHRPAERAPGRRRKAALPKMRKHRRITPLEPVHTRAPERRRKAAEPKMRKHRRITPLSPAKSGNV